MWTSTKFRVMNSTIKKVKGKKSQNIKRGKKGEKERKRCENISGIEVIRRCTAEKQSGKKCYK